MRNPTAPTSEEIRLWAFDTGASEPIPDWDLVLTWQADESYVRTFIELGSDPNCPKWQYFIDLLYFIVGYGVRKGHLPNQHFRYAKLVGLARGSQDTYIKSWHHRAKLLIDEPTTYNEEQWNLQRYPHEETL